MAQQLQNITVAAPGFAGLNTQDSPIGIDPSFAGIADNCVIDKLGRIGARKGWTEVSTNGASVLGSSRGIETVFEFVARDGTATVFSAGNNKIFTGTTTLAEVTLPVGYTITANNWKVVSFNNDVYFFQRDHAALVSVAGSTTLVEVVHGAHAAPEANEVLAAYGRLWAADITGNKHTVYWSDLLDGDAWHGGTAGSLDLTLVWPVGFDEVVSLAVHNDFLIIFGKKSIVAYSGAASPATMVLADTTEGVGCVARDSVQQTGTDILFLSETGVRSFARTIQEKSMPMRDLSKNVRSDLISLLANQTDPIKSVYSSTEAFYLLSFSNSNTIYCFDMRQALPDGSQRVTTWSSLNPYSFTVLEDNTIYIGLEDGIVKYDSYSQGTESYELRYFSNPLDFNNTANLKFLKKFNLTIIGGQNTPTILNWGYDYATTFSKQALIFDEAGFSEFGVGEYGEAVYSTGKIINKPRINTSGNGEVVTIGLEAEINAAAFSIQRIDIHALLGRLI